MRQERYSPKFDDALREWRKNRVGPLKCLRIRLRPLYRPDWRRWVGLGALIGVVGFLVFAGFYGCEEQAAGADRVDPPALLWRVTAYCPCEKCCGKWADGTTASGKKAEGYFVAAPPEIPFGTLVLVPGYADGDWVSVEDRGGAIKGLRLDVFFATHAEALEWGVKWVAVQRSNP